MNLILVYIFRPDHLNSHVRQVHSTERPFKCTVTPSPVYLFLNQHRQSCIQKTTTSKFQ